MDWSRAARPFGGVRSYRKYKYSRYYCARYSRRPFLVDGGGGGGGGARARARKPKAVVLLSLLYAPVTDGYRTAE